MREGQATTTRHRAPIAAGIAEFLVSLVLSSLIRVGLPDRRLSRGSSWSYFERAISIIIPRGHPRHLSSFGVLRSLLLPYFTSTFTTIPIENVETATFTRDNDNDCNDAVLLGGGGGGATNCR